MTLYQLLQRYTVKSNQIKIINIYNADNEYCHSNQNRDLNEKVMKFKFNKVTKGLDVTLWI